MGVDIGSTASKCLILKNGEEIISSSVVSSGTGTSGPARAVAAALEKAGLSREDISCVTATGYGRNTFEGADYVISELSAHAIGAHSLFPEARTLVDIGGQDAKAIRISAEGRLENFIMNDKCAAGTGRFLDVMARVLELEVSQLESRDAEADKAAKKPAAKKAAAKKDEADADEKPAKKASSKKASAKKAAAADDKADAAEDAK